MQQDLRQAFSTVGFNDVRLCMLCCVCSVNTCGPVYGRSWYLSPDMENGCVKMLHLQRFCFFCRLLNRKYFQEICIHMKWSVGGLLVTILYLTSSNQCEQSQRHSRVNGTNLPGSSKLLKVPLSSLLLYLSYLHGLTSNSITTE